MGGAISMCAVTCLPFSGLIQMTCAPQYDLVE